MEQKIARVMDANRKFVQVQQLVCKKCGKPFAIKTPEGYTTLYPPIEGKTCCCKEIKI